MPQTCDEVSGEVPTDQETPFYCLLEDDKLISKVQVETSWLLTEKRDDEHINDVSLYIRVKSITQNTTEYFRTF